MTEPSDLLSALTANPQMLKDAMQMASALASSGMLNGLFQKESPPEAKETVEPQKGSGDFANLLSGLLAGQSGGDSHSRETNAQAEHRTDKASDHGGTVDRARQNRPCHNDRIQLLRSLRPFLPEEKRDKIDFLIQLLGLLNAAEQLGVGKLF